MDSGTNNSIPTVFCQWTESLGPQVSTFLDLALGYSKALQQATSKTIQMISTHYCILAHAL